MVNKKQTIINETHHHYRLNKFLVSVFACLIVLIVVGETMSMVKHNENKYEEVYNKCIDGCGEQKFTDYELGDRGQTSDWTSRSEEAFLKIVKEQPIIQEYDRTECIESCNSLYSKIVVGK